MEEASTLHRPVYECGSSGFSGVTLTGSARVSDAELELELELEVRAQSVLAIYCIPVPVSTLWSIPRLLRTQEETPLREEWRSRSR